MAPREEVNTMLFIIQYAPSVELKSFLSVFDKTPPAWGVKSGTISFIGRPLIIRILYQ
jgi:hypothetical protein